MRTSRRYAVVIVVAILAVLVGTVGSFGLGALAKPSAKAKIAADPPPALFDAATVKPLQRQVDAQHARADALMRRWWRDHGRSRQDTAFTAWLERTLPGPPARATRDKEVAYVQGLASTRTPAGVRAASWLETHGKKDVWKLYAHDQAELLPAHGGHDRKKAVKDVLKLSKTVADTLGARYRQSAPYVLHPSLRPDHTVAKGQVCPCSYPSRHAAAAAAATTYLSARDPHRASDYQWMQSQIDWSRVYMAGHTTSDITAGALLGDLIGEYVAGTRSG